MSQRPERVQLGNLALGQSISAQYNPVGVKEKLEAAYHEIEVQGLSHTILQYDHTKSHALTFSLGFDGESADKADVQYLRNFILALLYPTRQATSVRSGSPPKTILVWPGLFSLEGRVRTCEIDHKRFDFSMRSTWFIADLGFSEARINRLYSEDVLRQGTQRSAQ